jgi:hypothetical protein
MPIYGFDINYCYNSDGSEERYHLLLEHDHAFSKEVFLEQLNLARETAINEHPDRLSHITGDRIIPVSSHKIARNMCKLFGYRTVELDILLEISEDEFFDDKVDDYVSNVDMKTIRAYEKRKQYNL